MAGSTATPIRVTRAIKRREIKTVLGSLGWRLVRHGRHDLWARGRERLVLPRHAEINEYTTRAILRKARGGE